MKRASNVPILVLSLLVPPAAHAQTQITGTWVTDAFGDTPNLIDLEVNGSEVTGTISRDHEVFSIHDGRVSDGIVTFKFFSVGGGRMISFSGRPTADGLHFTRSVEVLPGGAATGAGIFGAMGPMEFDTRPYPAGESRIPRRMLGNWRLDLQRSRYDPGPAPRLMIPDAASLVAQPDGWFSSINVGVNSNGTPYFSISSLKADGKDYAQQNGNTMTALLTAGTPSALTIAADVVDSNTVEYTYRNGGTVTAISRMVLSQDGNTVTVAVRQFNSEGLVTATNTVVWGRLLPSQR